MRLCECGQVRGRPRPRTGFRGPPLACSWQPGEEGVPVHSVFVFCPLVGAVPLKHLPRVGGGGRHWVWFVSQCP